MAQDNAYDTWTAWGNQYWPAEYLIDAHGRVRHAHFGEGDYAPERARRARPAARGRGEELPPPTSVDVPKPSADLATPETYLGALRAQGWLRAPQLGTHSYAPPDGQLPLSKFAYGGTWHITGQSATPTSSGAGIDATFQAQKVYLVLSSAGGTPRHVGVMVDGERTHGVTVTGQRLYTLVSLPRPGRHTLHVDVPRGVSGYAFTFG